MREALRKLRSYIADLILNPKGAEPLDIATLLKIEKAVEKQAVIEEKGAEDT